VPDNDDGYYDAYDDGYGHPGDGHPRVRVV
jgi:hypothetical protein